MAKELAVIELRLEGAEGVREMLERIEDLKKSAEGRIEIRTATESAHRKILELKADMDALRKTMENSDKDSDSYKNAAKGLKETRQEARATQTEYRILNKAKQDAAKIDREIAKSEAQAAKEAEKMAKEEAKAAAELERLAAQAPKVKTLGENFKTWSSRIAHAGSAMQSFGNALTQLTSPFKQLTSGIVMGAGYKMLNKFTEGLSNGFNRYDTMKKYPKIMAAFGYSNEEAQKSIDALDKSVRGLPTGLDEMVDLAQRFTATTGDIDKGTKLAIAANNAFLASMSTDTQKYQGMMQLQDVLGGKDMNSREWNSLVSSMTPAIVKMGESLGYTNKNMDEWIQQVRDGKVDNQKFIDTLIEIGNEGGVLQAMANESKDTWQAFFANVGNAASRMTAGVITSMDEIVKTLGLKDKDGNAIESVNRLLSDRLIPTIDDMTASAKDWIKAHPQEITDFFKQLAGINWRSLATGLLQGLKVQAEMFSLFANIANKVGGGSLAWVTRWGVLLNLVGKGFTIFGGLLKGTRHPLGGLIALLTTKIGGKGLFGGLIEKIFGKKLPTKEIAEAPKAIDSLRGVVKSLSGLMKVAGGVLIASGTGFVAFRSFKTMMSDLKDIIDIMSDIDWEKGAGAITAMTTFFGACAGLGKFASMNMSAVGDILAGEVGVGLITTVAAGFADLDMHLLKGSFKAFSDAVGYLKKGIDDLNSIGIIGDISKSKVRVRQAIDTFNEVIDMFENEGNGSKADDAQGKTGGKKLKALGSGTVDAVKNLSSVLKSMKGSIDAINEISHMKVNIGGITSIMPKISTALIAIGGALTNIPINLTSEANAKEFANMSTSLTNAKEGFKALIGRDGLIAQIPQIIQAVAKLQRSGDFEAFADKMQDLGGAIDNILNAMDVGSYDTGKMSTDIANIVTALDNVQDILKKLKKLGKTEIDTAGTDNIKTVIDNIKTAFDEAHASELSGQIMVFVTAIEAALQEFEKFSTPIEITPTIKLGSGFQSSVNQTARKIRSGRDDIQDAIDDIPSYYYKSVTVHIAANVVTSGLSGAAGKLTSGLSSKADEIRNAASKWRAMGGLIYRANGGSVFKPRGTDRIPAMLTQGEYVHRKQAVDYFGVDFMRKVNNMDVRGAMQSLLTRAGNNNSFNRQSVINNTVNNNQRVTQNINTNNPNFTRVQMGRFAGAL